MGKWYWSRSRAERWILLACVVFAPVELAAKAISHATAYGDFNVHRDFGRRFLAGQPLYPGDRCFNYMPVSALYYAPLALVPPAVASLARTATAMACLLYVMYAMGSMIRGRARRGPWPGLVVAALAVLLCGQYVLRDLDDGGPHLIYLAMLVAAIRCVRAGREGWAAVGFGLAIALKMTPGLFLPFFVWKRRWRLAIGSAVAAAAWVALPAAWMGPASWWDHQSQWNRLAFRVLGDRMDPVRAANEVRVQNQALKPAVARLLTAYPAGHPLKLDHPLDAPAGRLDEATANRLATLACLGLLAGVAYWSRRPWSGDDDPAIVLEMTAVLVLIPLLSPVTWLQHLPFVLPAAYLLVAEHVAFRRWRLRVAVAMGAYGLVTVACNRGVIGRDASLLLFSWHAHTWAVVGLLGLLMGLRPATRPADALAADEPPAARDPVPRPTPVAPAHPSGRPRRPFALRKVARAWGSRSS